MKSNKKRKAEIVAARTKKSEKNSAYINPYREPVPDWAVRVNPDEIVYHSLFMDIPLFYLDREFNCKKCGKTEIWTAERQKWWYEVAKGSFETTAAVCRECRDKKKAYVDQQKAHLEELKKKKPHQNEKFFKKT
ncbi:zinc-ribbon domain containing protein [Simiduia aestuariiviva]|uniref:Probable zinc-binding domain-containing protein n=1 Tax=Simiduia aestuariiviva TaxID=1510459 RepID=A0A839UNN8_9GAMM|nr:zinc-ribbon domain containing protein [Simiduia aestuariiviva]MBB3169452.1 hypothetical protein [Simiduia aestuariiviva]